jgi:hypothetical protein
LERWLAVARTLMGDVDPANPTWARVIAFMARLWPRIWWVVGGVVAFGLALYLFVALGNTEFYPLLFGLRRVLSIVEILAILGLVVLVGLAFRLRMAANDRHERGEARYRQAEQAAPEQRAPLVDAAITDWRDALAVCPRPLAPREWASTQFALARAAVARAHSAPHAVDGADQSLLLEALGAYRAAAEVYARRSELVEWAQVQRAIGDTLRARAEAAPEAKRPPLFGEAAAAYRAALGALPREAQPRAWADTQIAIARMWLAAAESAQPPERGRLLGEAATGYRLALPEYARHATREDWATLQHTLGGTLIQQATEAEGAERVRLLDESLARYREALTVATRWAQPGEWAALQAETGAALRLRAQMTGDQRERSRWLDAAVAALDGALEVRTPEEYPAEWAATEGALGGTLLDAAQLYEGPERIRLLREAVATLDAATRALSAQGATAAAEATRAELARATALLGAG